MRTKRPQGRKIIISLAGAALLFGAGFFARGLWQQAEKIEPLGQNIDLFGQDDLRFFPIQSIDTMKTSRDRAREKLHDPSFDAEIEREIALIKEAGATHVAIGTPYDEEFIPILRRWVGHARAAGLSVWFRGNLSGWEGWFGYPRIGREEHLAKLEDFLRSHGDLFASGDVFSPCPECENGGPGDPRRGDAEGFRRFLMTEHDLAGKIFGEQGKDIRIYTSMNADIARDIIDPETAKKLDGILIDHYTREPSSLALHRAEIAEDLDSPVGIGEFGAPIPDIHGNMSEEDQARFIGEALQSLIGNENIPLVNYWTLDRGSASLTRDDGSKKPAYDALAAYFSPVAITGSVRDPLGHQLGDVSVRLASSSIEARTERTGEYRMLVPSGEISLAFEKEGYWAVASSVNEKGAAKLDVTLYPVKPSLWYKIREFFSGLSN